MNNFNPEDFSFICRGIRDSYGQIDVTFRNEPVPNITVGCYQLDWDKNNNNYKLSEIYCVNEKEKLVTLSQGKIPTEEFAFELFKNLELEIPRILREVKINEII